MKSAVLNTAENIAHGEPKPFLKWAGGKRSVLPELLKRTPPKFGKYFEPFVGGGALFFALQPENAVLSDINSELINCFVVVRDKVEDLITHLATHKSGKRYYYQVRALDRRTDYWLLSPIEKASRFIYLNKTCFNGLCRVNSAGCFNVPYGDYKNPKICDADNLRDCSAALRSVQLQVQSFDQIEQLSSKGDFVYFDPPYAPLSATASFTSYAKEGFSPREQEQLAEMCRALDRKGVKFMLSNSAVPSVRKLYEGFHLEVIPTLRTISARHSSRGQVEDLVVRNY